LGWLRLLRVFKHKANHSPNGVLIVQFSSPNRNARRTNPGTVISYNHRMTKRIAMTGALIRALSPKTINCLETILAMPCVKGFWGPFGNCFL
jgi:hypothetical protein